MTALWHIRLFGDLAVGRSGGGETFSRFGTRKAGAMLAFLAFHRGRGRTREELCDLLWPDEPPQTGRARLRVALASLRRQLEPPGVPAGSVLVAEGHERVWLSADAVATDVADVEAALKALLPEDAPPTAERVAAAHVIVSRFARPLLTGFYEDWVTEERERLTQAAVERLSALARRLPHEQGMEFAQHAARLDPLAEEPLFALLPLLAAGGQHGAALRAYQSFARRWEEAMGGPPSDELQELAGSLPEGRRKPVPDASPVTAEPRPAPAPPPRGWPKRLPSYLTRSFGRDSDRDALRMALGQARLVTLTGPGGIGKTRLAVETARGWEGPCWFVPLAEADAAERIPYAVADALGDLLAGRRPAVDTPDARLTLAAEALNGLEPSPAGPLLVLDNLEQIADAAGSALLALLERVPALRLLVTSRLRVHLPGEREYPLAPLPLPPEEDRPLEEATAVPSVALFLDRARAARPDFQITERNRGDVLAVCRMLEGIPLAVELVAARGGTLVPSRMRDMLVEQGGGLRVADRRAREDERHRSLWTAIEWSYRLLPPRLRRLFAHLSVFRGGFVAGAAAAVADVDPEDAAEALARLRAHSLVGSVADADEMRFSLLESLRAFAAEKLTDEEREEARRRHARWYADLAEQAEGGSSGPAEVSWFGRLEAEQDNLRAALETLLEDDPRRAVQAAGALWGYWNVRGRYSEGRSWLERALRVAPDPEDEPDASAHTVHRSRALQGAAALALAVAQGDGATARPLYEESLRLSRRAGGAAAVASTLNSLGLLALTRKEWDEARALLGESLAIRRAEGGAAAAEIAGSLLNLGVVEWERGDAAGSRAFFEEALALYRAQGNRVGEGRTLNNLGGVASALGDFAESENWYRQSLAIKRETGHAPGIAITLANIGVAAMYQGRYGDAAAHFEESLAMYREIGAPDETAQQLRNLAQIATYRGDWGRAYSMLTEALEIVRGLETPDDIAADLEGFALFAAARGRFDVVARLLGAAGAIREATGSPLFPTELVAVEKAAGDAQAALGEEDYRAAFAEGASLTPEAAASLALTLAP